MVSTQKPPNRQSWGVGYICTFLIFPLFLNAKTLFYTFVKIFPLPTWHKISVKNTLIKSSPDFACAHAVFFLYNKV